VKPSRLFLKGTTNVNKFACECEDQFVLQELEITKGNDARIQFQNARLSMTTRKFNCRNEKIDRDMQKALKAEEYPKIVIDLLETCSKNEQSNSQESGWFDIEAKVNVTITGVTKEKQIMAIARKLDNGQFALKGSETLHMSEFGIVPPTAMFGLIKVNDQITLHFDLTIQLD
ncbi:MAG: YceI family protein, partial [Saprospiraceae bacterium]